MQWSYPHGTEPSSYLSLFYLTGSRPMFSIIISCSITSTNIVLYELPLFLGSEHSQTQPSEDLKQYKMCMLH